MTISEEIAKLDFSYLQAYDKLCDENSLYGKLIFSIDHEAKMYFYSSIDSFIANPNCPHELGQLYDACSRVGISRFKLHAWLCDYLPTLSRFSYS